MNSLTQFIQTLLSLGKSIKLVIKMGSTPILILDTPTLTTDIMNLCPLEKIKLPSLFKSHSCQLSISFLKQQKTSFFKFNNETKKRIS